MLVTTALLLLATSASNLRPSGSRTQAPEAALHQAQSKGRLTARIVDEQGAPRPNLSLHHFSYNDGAIGNGTSVDGGRDGWIKSDASGWIRLELTAAELAEGPRYFNLSDLDWDSPAGELQAEFYMPDNFHSGVLDLGDLLIAPRGSAKRFAKLDDNELQGEFDRLLRLKSHREEMYEDLVFECVRRGGTRWAEYFEALIESRRPKSEADRFPLGLCPNALTLLTAARRLRSKPDPLSIRLEPGSPVDFSTADHPVLRLCWRNVDSSESITIQPPEQVASTYGPVNIEAKDMTGRFLAPRTVPSDDPCMMSGGVKSATLAPGEELHVTLALERYIQQLEPGEFRVRVRYHDWSRIIDRSSLAGLILSSSPEFVIRVRAP